MSLMRTLRIMYTCEDDSFVDEVDRDVNTGRSKNFLERQGLVIVGQASKPQQQPSAWKSHRIPLEAPLPLPIYQRALLGEPAPDRGQSFDWPHPVFTEPQ